LQHRGRLARACSCSAQRPWGGASCFLANLLFLRESGATDEGHPEAVAEPRRNVFCAEQSPPEEYLWALGAAACCAAARF